MSDSRLVVSAAEAAANIERYERELERSADLQSVMSYARAWHGFRAEDGSWRVAPSKFAGYASNTAALYLQSHRERDGRVTERVLEAWSETVVPGSATYDEIVEAVLRLFSRYGRTPNKLMRVSSLRTGRMPDAEPTNVHRERSDLRARVTIDPRVCGGRPTIRGMRIRVSDVLDLLAAGATRREILADYPYLENDDISAALAFAAAASDHRIVA